MIHLSGRSLTWPALIATCLLLSSSVVRGADERPAIRVLLWMPKSGTFAALGERQAKGARLALAETGSRAGQRSIDLVDAEEPQDSQSAVQRIRSYTTGDDRIAAVVGVFNGSIGNAIRDQLHNSQTVTIITQATTRNLTGSRRSPYIFRVTGTTYTSSQSLADWVNSAHVCKSVISVAANYTAGQEFTRFFTQPFEAAGGKVLDKIWPQLGTTDFSPYLTTILDRKPDCLYVWLSGPDAVRFVQQYERYGLKKLGIKLVGASYVDPSNLAAQGQAAIGAYAVVIWEEGLDNPESKAFVASYKKAYNESPDHQSFNGYLGMKALLRAIDAISGDVEQPDKLAAALKAISFPTGDGTPLRFDPKTNSRDMIYGIYQVVAGSSGAPELKPVSRGTPIADPGDDVLP